MTSEASITTWEFVSAMVRMAFASNKAALCVLMCPRALSKSTEPLDSTTSIIAV